MDQKLVDIYNETVQTMEELTIKYNREKWNFFTNATSENYNQYYNIIDEFVNYISYNQNIPFLIEERKKTHSKFNKNEKLIIDKIASIHNIYERKSKLSDEYFTTLLDHQKNVINKRIQYNSKDSTTNHIADLCQRNTSLKAIKKLQNDYFFQPISEYSAEIKGIIKLRNAYFKERGYKSFLHYFLKENNMTTAKISRTMEKIHKSTIKPYRSIKNKLEKNLISKFNSRSQHIPGYIYGDPFFRFYPVHIDENVNIMFKGKDIAYAVKKFFSNIGMDIDNIYEVSDLYIRPGKYQNPIIVDMDRKGDVRFSVNSKSNYRGIYFLLRTVGKVVYKANVSPKIPFLLNELPDRGIVEGFTMFLTKYALKHGFISKIIAQYEEEDEQIRINICDYLELTEIIYIRQQLALANFEMNMYSHSNLTNLWMDSVNKYQLIGKKYINEENGWAMIDSMVFDPFSSIAELDGFLIQNDIEKIVAKQNLSSKNLMGFFLENLIQYGNKIDKKHLSKLMK